MIFIDDSPDDIESFEEIYKALDGILNKEFECCAEWVHIHLRQDLVCVLET